MSTQAPPTPQRLCPHCASVAVTAAHDCPWCGRSYRRRILPGVAAFLLVQTAVILAVVLFALAQTGDTVQTQVDDGITQIQREVDKSVNDVDVRLRRELRDELDQRLP